MLGVVALLAGGLDDDTLDVASAGTVNVQAAWSVTALAAHVSQPLVVHERRAARLAVAREVAARTVGMKLLVETLAYAPGFITTMRRYVPQSAAMRSMERFYREGERLVLEITYADPITLTMPLTFEYRFRRSDFDVVVYGCTPENAGYGDR